MLDIQDISGMRQERKLFNPVSFQIMLGQALLVRGRNGIGKSSLLRMLVGLLPCTGQAMLHDRPLDPSTQVNYISHRNNLQPHLTVWQNLTHWVTLLGGAIDKAQIFDILKQWRLYHLAECKAGELSAGQAQRASLARLVLRPAPVWILDEPLSHLDTKGCCWIYELLQGHLAQQGIAIVVSHQQAELQDLCFQELNLEHYVE